MPMSVGIEATCGLGRLAISASVALFDNKLNSCSSKYRINVSVIEATLTIPLPKKLITPFNNTSRDFLKLFASVAMADVVNEFDHVVMRWCLDASERRPAPSIFANRALKKQHMEVNV